MGFWLQQGLSGFRVDAVPFLIEGALDDPHQILRDLRAYVNRRNGEAILLGEVNLAPKEVRDVPRRRGRRRAAHGAGLHRQPGVLPGARARLGGAAGDAPCASSRRSRETASLGRFVRNHDELTLDKLSEEERAEVFARFGPDPELQLYGRGLRRRLPTMLDGDQRAIRMAYSLAFSLPGTPVLFYGEEIGMAENLAIEGRYAVRAPMQWSPTTAASRRPIEPRRPMVEGEWGPQRVNVADQRRDPGSLLNWFERLIRRRRECPELGFGTMTVLDTGATPCSPTAATGTARPSSPSTSSRASRSRSRCRIDDGEELVDLFEAAEHPLPATLDLEPYAAHWFRVRRDGIRLPP